MGCWLHRISHEWEKMKELGIPEELEKFKKHIVEEKASVLY